MRIRESRMQVIVLLIVCSMAAMRPAHAQQRGIINNEQRPHVALKSINIGDCKWTSGFWADKFKLCEEVMVPHMGKLLKGDTGHAYNNFKIAAGLKQGRHEGMHWHDGDFYKWMESAMYVYAINHDPMILKELDEIIEVIANAQEDDGYLSTQITLTDVGRWSNRKYHELYNSGHLLTSACIHHRVTGQRNLHTTIGDMVQERTPLRKSDEAVGHAVLALYFYAGATDVYAETGEQALIEALDRLWENVVHKKMYLTGACGQTHHGSSSNVDFVHEAFIDEYMMPNLTAYNETCANICNAMFSYRMLGVKGESKYADIMELVLYNSALSGISVDGTHYFYTNPLRRTRDHEMDTTDQRTRAPYIPCFCCPPNLVRTIAKVSSWTYSLAENGITVNLYGGNQLKVAIKRGPVVYCIESPDLPSGAGILDVYLPEHSRLEPQYRADFLGGVTTIEGNVLLRSDKQKGMYRTITKPVWKSARTTFVPYYAWSNRGEAEMTVWMPIVWD